MTALAGNVAAGLAAAAARRDVTTFRPVLLECGAAGAAAALAELAADPTVVVVDEVLAQLEQLTRGRALDGKPVAVADLLEGRPPAAFGTWAFYPWSRRLVHVLPAPLHRELRLDRNRYAITADEQVRLGRLCVAVAGLSVGRAIVSVLAHEGIGGELRLADFDVLELSNLNRVAGGLADVGTPKLVLAAREIAELDPYIRVVAFPQGVEEATIARFVNGADVVVDECDDLAMKVRLREEARAAGRPVVMATSHRGMLDVERFDLEPRRKLFHGLLGDVDSDELRHLTAKQKVPYVMRIVGAESLGDRAAASLLEVRQSLSTWPQLASEVVLGGAMAANAVRRIALGGLRASGRFHADLDALTADGRQAPLAPPPASLPPATAAPVPRMPARGAPLREQLRFVAACAGSAPSGGNMQPWRFVAKGSALRAYVDPARSSFLDFRGRATLLALGAALEAAEIGARGLGLDPVARTPTGDDATWELALAPSSRAADERTVQILWERCSNRRTGGSAPIPWAELAALARCAAPLEAGVVADDALPALGAALGALDRVRFLSARLRQELLGELRPGPAPDGIDIAALELAGADRAAMDLLRSGAGLNLLADLDRGWGLCEPARDAFAGSAGALVLRATATDRDALLAAGRGLMRLWLEATRRRLAVHPWGSPFLFQRLVEAPGTLDAWERRALTDAAAKFGRIATLDPDRPVLLVLRLSAGTAPSARSLRRPVEDVLRFAS
jgi:molybdopterin/thiamine biosynthesis adenylyltransferase